MHYEGQIIRPPSEGDSILLQVTVGCSHNSCAFCGAYLGERFRIKDEAVVFEDIDFAARHMPGMRRLFLCDGDAMAMPTRRLTRILERIRERLPRVGRMGVYASAMSLAPKSPEELETLRGLGLSMVYMGLESGDDELLAAMGKKARVADMLAQAAKVRQAGMKLSVTVITGLAGASGWERHARLTGEALAAMEPDQAATLSLIAVPGTPLWTDIESGRFVPQDAQALVRELRMLLEHTAMPRGLFLADHASNHVPLKLRLPRDRQYGLDLLDAVIQGRKPLKPEHMRGL
ncbi:B12-binding domain-containing radical SAM protein [Fundidesulfovibrio terrae]|uniref:B12-binding domain-containing radical SAM protein n=1 Tax=Fundidesulfovibrio terrae TaxID=2922866 RepID=UPI001FAF23C1|nr:radical SAM protein [Fundidesulfovibrio terrae]